jgi:aryl-phospho-beta-D-glucosidase BglC (GH1 family)
MEFLRVKGDEIITAGGEPVRLRGFCLGGWMLMENFINGFAGNEAAFRAAVAKALGGKKAAFFFERMLHYFMTEDDIRFIASLGANTVRVPFNYRHFEDDRKPFKYKKEGFARLDRVIGWCRKHGIYAILDMHAVQGFQNTDWHCDNPGMFPWLYEHPHFQERAIALWQAIARRYKNEAGVAGYNLMNETQRVL